MNAYIVKYFSKWLHFTIKNNLVMNKALIDKPYDRISVLNFQWFNRLWKLNKLHISPCSTIVALGKLTDIPDSQDSSSVKLGTNTYF